MTSPAPRIVCAIHGILTSQTEPSWCDAFDAWMWSEDPDIRVIKREYFAAPIRFWNVWVKNPALARALSTDVIELCHGQRVLPLVDIIAHSNGACIALLAARRLADAGVKLGTLVLVGAACSSDAEDAGVLDLIGSGSLERAVAYSSRDDAVVSSPLIWPYGRLGHEGWQIDGIPVANDAVFTRWFEGGHSSYFAKENREATFRAAARDMNLPIVRVP